VVRLGSQPVMLAGGVEALVRGLGVRGTLVSSSLSLLPG
jgi:hypothetical protein